MPARIVKRRTFIRTTAVVSLAASLAGCTWIEVLLAPMAKPWPRWKRHDNANPAKIDHGPWQAFLASYVDAGKDGINRVRYPEVAGQDRGALSAYLAYLTSLPISGFARAEQRAYWINLYNARTIRLILEHYPVASIMDIDISPGWLSFGPWDKKLLTVEATELSLNDIEHRILRGGWSDNRLHYALNCAALGCPNLNPVAFTGANAEALLVAGARAYINHPRGVAIVGDEVVLSKIYAWFKEDFNGRDSGVIEHLKSYAAQDLKTSLHQATGISNYLYDWSLNGS